MKQETTQAAEWISVESKLPQEGDVVTILYNNKETDTSMFCNGTFFIYDTTPKPITHWKFLSNNTPAAPVPEASAIEGVKFDELSKEAQQPYFDKAVSLLSDDLYFCTRVWEAWHHNTMTENDFVKANEDSDLIHDIAEAIYESTTPVKESPAPDNLPIRVFAGHDELKQNEFFFNRENNTLNILVSIDL